MNRARVDNEGRFHHMCWIEYEGGGVMSDSHAHEWNDAWGADCDICHIDLNEYADTAQARIAQLEAENAAMREIVEAVAAYKPSIVGIYEHTADADCPFCDESVDNLQSSPLDFGGGIDHHTPDCPVTKARAILATNEQTPSL